MGLTKIRLITKAGTSNNKKIPTASQIMNVAENNPKAKSKAMNRYIARQAQPIF